MTTIFSGSNYATGTLEKNDNPRKYGRQSVYMAAAVPSNRLNAFTPLEHLKEELINGANLYSEYISDLTYGMGNFYHLPKDGSELYKTMITVNHLLPLAAKPQQLNPYALSISTKPSVQDPPVTTNKEVNPSFSNLLFGSPYSFRSNSVNNNEKYSSALPVKRMRKLRKSCIQQSLFSRSSIVWHIVLAIQRLRERDFIEKLIAIRKFQLQSLHGKTLYHLHKLSTSTTGSKS